ncbi:uncharacterized protein B0I36DRAFT_365646 [Microdochium trichocladiopsis]|uniref:Nuclear pore complex protein Nup85 n=1 Tax=Microdochium trichocladiopsis TaxID=1682393 RepID=A0A9P8Y012_9PEZI|nr:uncharacterized protein B0I36DRAFT_365646 [Microdochium trichocladiopsis]KAH7026015.1 hypothetical protein B0I36DRAFT_365646 [Microdochium trichocladiopsis]
MPFHLPSSSPAPSTPERRSAASRYVYDADHPSTTPAGPPPPSSAASFTPAGEPSPSFLKSSIGVMAGSVKAPNFGRPKATANRSPSVKSHKAPLGRSLRSARGSTTRQPSSLSRQYFGDDDDDDDEGLEEEQEYQQELPPSRPGTFGINYDDESDGDDTENGNDTLQLDHDDYQDAEGEDDYEGRDEAMDEDADAEYDIEEDLLREIASVEPYGGALNDREEDAMMLTTPAADERVRREADNIMRASSMRHTRRRECRYVPLAKDLTSHTDFAQVSEPANVILQTEDIINRLYDEGVGPTDDVELLEEALSKASVRLLDRVWAPHANSMLTPYREQAAKVGPSAEEPDFKKAEYLARLMLTLYHNPPSQTEFGGPRYQALPGILFEWQDQNQNLDKDQIQTVKNYRPAPAAHALFWPCVFSSLIRGNISDTIQLLGGAAWASAKKAPRGKPLYASHAAENIVRAVEDMCFVIEQCPAHSDGSWDIRSSDWTLFRLKAQAAKESLISFAEGKVPAQSSFGRGGRGQYSDMMDSTQSLAGMSRRAQSLIPWDVYENLQSLYSIMVGEPDPILAAANDWCDATLGLFGWWDDGHNKSSHGRSLSRSITAAGDSHADDIFFDRLAMCLHATTESNFHFNSTDAIEVGVACVFEGNVEAAISILRMWSLPVASSVAEIASLGRWLPPSEPQNLIGMESFDQEDMEVLGLSTAAGMDEKDGLKDTTLIHYARGLRDRKHVSGQGLTGRTSRDGWELAVQVVGRLDSPERSEEIVRELLGGVLATIDEGSHDTVDKIWRLLNELGMINFAEDTAETFGDILARDTHRYGQTLWYYSLAHRPDKLRDVLNTLMSISLVESTVYPPENQLDENLRSLLQERTTTLERFAKQDLEAAELLGKMLSGYATLRRFYERRDSIENPTGRNSVAKRQQAASALIAVIASADDNIRGGLYDDSRDAVVSEDFLLALLGEASVFIGQSPAVITLEQIDVLLKAIEDIQSVGSRVYDAADEFFKLVLASGQGVKGSTPADLMKKSTTASGGSFMLTGSSMMASQFKQSVVKSGMIKGTIKRSWDWRTTGAITVGSGGNGNGNGNGSGGNNSSSSSQSQDALRKIRLGLTRDLANLWLEQADSVIV